MAFAGDVDTVKLLLEAGVPANLRDGKGATALHKAAEGGREACMRVLLSAHADVNAKDDYRYTPLHHAARGNHVACVQQLIAAEASLDEKEKINSLKNARKA